MKIKRERRKIITRERSKTRKYGGPVVLNFLHGGHGPWAGFYPDVEGFYPNVQFSHGFAC